MSKRSEEISNGFYRHLGVDGLERRVTAVRHRDDLRVIKREIRKHHKALDLACGYGRLTIPLAQAGFEVVGLDLAPNLLRSARRRARDLDVKVCFDLGSMLRLPYDGRSFDRIFCVWSSFNHLLTKSEQVRALNEMYRVLRRGGQAFVEMVNGEKKALREQVQREGRGPDKRVWGEVYDGIQNLTYIHTRKTLATACRASRFVRWRVGFQNLGRRRRLIAYLWK